MSFVGRVVIILFLLWGGGLFLFVKQEIRETGKRYREAVEEPLSDFSHLLAASVGSVSTKERLNLEPIRSAFEAAPLQPLQASIYRFRKTGFELVAYITDEMGIVIYDSRSGRDVGKDYSKWNDVYRTLRGTYGARSSVDDAENTPADIFFVASPIVVENSLRGVLAIGKPLTNTQSLITATRSTITQGALYTFVGLTLLTLLFAQLLQRPVRKLTRYARAVRDGENPVLPLFSLKELRSLAESLHEMRAALQGKLYIEKYVQTLTHELKSPLTGIKGALDILKEADSKEDRTKFLLNIETEADRIEKLTNNLLSLSALEVKNIPLTETIDIIDLLEDLLKQNAVRIIHKRLNIVKSFTQRTLKVVGNKFWLESALSNLLSNALDFSPYDAKIFISAVLVDRTIKIFIEDEGPGIPEWAFPKLFEKFFSLPRPDTNRKSSGLGLTIVKEVLTLHGGTVELSNRLEGGTKAVTTLPRAPHLN